MKLKINHLILGMLVVVAFCLSGCSRKTYQWSSMAGKQCFYACQNQNSQCLNSCNSRYCSPSDTACQLSKLSCIMNCKSADEGCYPGCPDLKEVTETVKPEEETKTEEVTKADEVEKNQKYKDLLNRYNAEKKELCMNVKHQTFLNKSACYGSDISFSQMADKSFATEEEKTCILNWQADLSKLADITKEMQMATTNSNLLKELSNQATWFNNEDKNIQNLYETKISWGDYNKKKKGVQ